MSDKTKVFTIRFPDDLLLKIDAVAKELGISKSSVIKMALTKYLKEAKV